MPLTRKHFAAPLAAALLALAGCDSILPLEPGTRRELIAPAHNPIIFVHGWNSTGSIWTTMVGRFKADGWTDAELHAWKYDFNISNATIASRLSAKVDSVLAATGASKVDIVTHSMGGLSSRYYSKNLGGSAKIDAWVSLGGPNHGTQFAYGCFSTSCVEMRPGSNFLKSLNASDETPGTPRYATWWSPCDEIINPDSSVSLIGATNTQTACIGHSAFYGDATVYAQVRAFVHP